MMNIILIKFTQQLPSLVAKAISRFRSFISKQQSHKITLIENIDHFPSVKPKMRNALVTLSPESWITALQQHPNIRHFNVCGLTFEIVRALNEQGYLVDIVDFAQEYMPTKLYDLVIAHGGNCRTLLDNISPSCPVIQYVSGVHWETFNRESTERYSSFEKRKSTRLEGGFRRSFSPAETVGSDYLCSRTDTFFTINCPRMMSSYGKYRGKFVFTGYGSYIEPCMQATKERQYDKGMKNFIYVGGTGGNIQKGMDVILEAFAATPDLNLYIYCKVENEILRHYQHELSRPNIHYIYHFRHPMFWGKMRDLIKKVNFTVHAPCNFGIGTAFMGSLGAGCIPVGYVDYAGPESSRVMADSWQVDSIIESIRTASMMSPDWCAKASSQAMEFYEQNCTSHSFYIKFSELIRNYNHDLVVESL
jgi:hypothetical protein